MEVFDLVSFPTPLQQLAEADDCAIADQNPTADVSAVRHALAARQPKALARGDTILVMTNGIAGKEGDKAAIDSLTNSHVCFRLMSTCNHSCRTRMNVQQLTG